MAEDTPLDEGGPPLPAPLGRTLAFVSCALALGCGLCWCLKEGSAGPETGTISGRPTPLLSDRSGRIELFWVKEGDLVEPGDPIAVLVDEQLVLQIDRLKRESAELQSALLRAQEQLEAQLAQTLSVLDAEIVAIKTQTGFGATDDVALRNRVTDLESQRLDAAHRAREQLGIDRLRNELLRAEARLETLLQSPQKITLPASAAGTVKCILRNPGERVVPGTPILELANQSQPYLVVEMPEPLAKRFALGDEIPLSFPGAENTVGRVAHMRFLEPQSSGQSSSRIAAKPNVRVEIEPADQTWPEIPLESPVSVRTSDAKALSRRVN